MLDANRDMNHGQVILARGHDAENTRNPQGTEYFADYASIHILGVVYKKKRHLADELSNQKLIL